MMWNILILMVFILIDYYSPAAFGIFTHLLILVSLLWITRDLVRKWRFRKTLV